MNPREKKHPGGLLYTVYFIYFFCGMALCFEGAFNPEFKEYFQLSYQQQQYTTFAKNIPFALAVVIGFLIPRIGYKNCLTIAMALFAAGTLLLIPGLQSGNYALVLFAFFVIGLGFNFQLVAGNPLLAGLGSPEGSSSRLNLGNALGAIAQIIAPFLLTLIIPAGALSVAGKMPYMKGLFLAIGIVLIALAVLTAIPGNDGLFFNRRPAGATTQSVPNLPSPWTQSRVLFGFVTIFLVLGAEAGLFGFFRNYVEDPGIAGASSRSSQQLFTAYFATFAFGRFVSSWIQKRVRPARTLILNAAGALICVFLMLATKGSFAVASFLLVGFFVSSFFPTLYSLAIEGLGEQTAKASGLLTMGFLGCALLPVLQGRLADKIGLQRSFAGCIVPYIFVTFYAIHCRRAGRAAGSVPGLRPESTVSNQDQMPSLGVKK
ncbi:MAG TPA: MFS transporter [Verrucomicrobiae bacterium]|nr:MFS transporter [Verrucomicrobiae bacterium]